MKNFKKPKKNSQKKQVIRIKTKTESEKINQNQSPSYKIEVRQGGDDGNFYLTPTMVKNSVKRLLSDYSCT
jgi:hypothetical protein